MDTTSLPDLADWDVVIDGAPQAVTAVVWQNPTTARFTYAGFGDPVATGIIRLNVQDDDTKSTEGAIAIFPQQSQFLP